MNNFEISNLKSEILPPDCSTGKATLGRMVILVLAALLLSFAALAQSTAFTYQGRLNHADSPATGLYEITFTLYDSATNGNVIGTPVTVAPVPVTNGLFAATLDFGPTPFTGASRWLEVSVTVFGSDQPVVTLTPRQALTSTPYAIRAASVSGPIADNQLSSNVVRLNVNQTLTGAVRFAPRTGSPFAVETSDKIIKLNADLLDGLDSASFWNVHGNSNTIHGTHFLGTTDDRPLEFRTAGNRALRFDARGGGLISITAGHMANFVDSWGATISGGGSSESSNSVFAAFGVVGGGEGNTVQTSATWSTIAGGHKNTVGFSAERGVIGGGIGNKIEQFSWSGTIAGGSGNTLHASAHSSTIGGGGANRVGINSELATISGGQLNRVHDRVSFATVAGGDLNEIRTSADTAAISGGRLNMISTNADGAFIAGGHGNRILSDAGHASIGGGVFNTVDENAGVSVIGGGTSNWIGASARFATIPGGYDNRALAAHSFACGTHAIAKHAGAFVWADSSDFRFRSTTSNQFSLRAAGGVRFVTAIDINGTPSAGVSLAPGSGTWSSLSDRNAKENFTPTQPREVLDKVTALPIATWNYKSQDKSVRHIGPTAQDFHAAFNVGENDRTITTVDADGVALAAIQGLNQKLEQELKTKDAQIRQLQSDLAQVKQLIQTLANR